MVFWDLFGEQGHPIRATVAEMGPLLMARLLELNDTQEGVLNIAFRVADEQGLLLLDLKDLRAMLQYRRRPRRPTSPRATAMSRPPRSAPSSASCWCWRTRAPTNFFGEPALEIDDFLARDAERARRRQHPGGRQADAHARGSTPPSCCGSCRSCSSRCRRSATSTSRSSCSSSTRRICCSTTRPKACCDAIEQVVRLIRSKGVGVYFVTQNPLDVPDTVLGQLGNRVQHALRAFTPRDQQAVKAAADTFRQNPAFDTAEAITQLGVGEALVSMLQPDGTPEIVAAHPDRAARPRGSARSRRTSAGSIIEQRPDLRQVRHAGRPRLRPSRCCSERAAPGAPASAAAAGAAGATQQAGAPAPSRRRAGRQIGEARSAGGGTAAASSRGRMTTGQLIVRSAVQSAARSIGTQVAREIMRGVLGGMQRCSRDVGDQIYGSFHKTVMAGRYCRAALSRRRLTCPVCRPSRIRRTGA